MALKFNLNLSEYLKGSGPSSIVAVWMDGHTFDTSADAENGKAAVLARRDPQWDDREAIIFLYGEGSGFGTKLWMSRSNAQTTFLLYVGDPYSRRRLLQPAQQDEQDVAAGCKPEFFSGREFFWRRSGVPAGCPSVVGSFGGERQFNHTDDYPQRPEEAYQRGQCRVY